CRAGTSTAFNLGPAITSHQANFRGTEPYGGAARGPNLRRTVPVGRYPPNGWGLYDMHGQVWEWCSDFYDPDYPPRGGRPDPTGPRSGEGRCQRGGCGGAIARCCRSAYRCSDSPGSGQYAFGFRVAMTVRRPPARRARERSWR